MYVDETIKVPQTDLEVYETLVKTERPSELASWGIYQIYRKRDEMSVSDAWLATLNYIIDLYTKKDQS